MNSRPLHAELSHQLRLSLLVMPILLACSDPPSGAGSGKPRGSMTITVAAQGLDYPDTFRAQLNTNFTSRDIKPNESVNLASVFAGTYTVALIQLPSNCTAAESSKTVKVEGGGSVAIRFDVTCVATYGALRVNVSTSGVDVDPTGYRLQLSSGPSFLTAANGATIFARVPAGSQIADIGGIASNCTLAGSPTQAFTVSVGSIHRDTAKVSFSLACSKTEKFAMRRVYPTNTGGAPNSVDVSYADGSEVVSITAGYAPAWSPDGHSLAFQWLDCGYYYYYGCNKSGLAVMNNETGSFIVLTRDTLDSDPAWRPPDGAVIAFGRGRALYFISAGLPNGSATELVTPQNVLKASQPSWSPDATKLAFACEIDDRRADICVIGADGTGFVRLTNDLLIHSNPEWSPDGSRIAFHTSDGGLDTQIAVMSSAGGAITNLTSGKNPSWSRDGTTILFEAPFSTRGIFKIALASGTVTRLTNGDDHDPAWRP